MSRKKEEHTLLRLMEFIKKRKINSLHAVATNETAGGLLPL